LAGVRDAVPTAHIACTQISKNCHSRDLTHGSAGHLSRKWPSAGMTAGACCAGTVVVRATEDGAIAYGPSQAHHSQFVIQNVDAPKCLNLTI
jgi:competence protein ComEC